jgi:hypothetical protein
MKTKGFVLLLLDLVGTLLFAIGALGRFGGYDDLVPAALRFPGHNLVLITLGILLIVPYALHVIAGARTTRR